MTKEVPYIDHMIIVPDILSEKNKKNNLRDETYYNPEYDSDCEYCMNTTAWD